MAHPSTLYRFRIDLSDVDRGVYEPLDFRVAMHPSETTLFLLTRVLAFALNAGPGLEFSPGGLSDPDAPGIQRPSPQGGLATWIEIGNPSARKLHKAAKGAREVKVYTYKDPQLLLREARAAHVHRAEDIEIYAFAPEFLEHLSERLERDNKWSVIHTEGSLIVQIGEHSKQMELRLLRI